MTAPHPEKLPAILLDAFDEISIFHLDLTKDRCRARAGILETKVYAEKEEPQPQLLVELGLMKLKPWRMRVSSKSRTMPAR